MEFSYYFVTTFKFHIIPFTQLVSIEVIGIVWKLKGFLTSWYQYDRSLYRTSLVEILFLCKLVRTSINNWVHNLTFSMDWILSEKNVYDICHTRLVTITEDCTDLYNIYVQYLLISKLCVYFSNHQTEVDLFQYKKVTYLIKDRI